MMVRGMAIGPIMLGTLAKFVGFGEIGFAALAFGGVATLVLAVLSWSVARGRSGAVQVVGGSAADCGLRKRAPCGHSRTHLSFPMALR